jgi:formate dehydrogenase major subunit
MTSLTALLSKWPLIRQIRERADGTGLEAMSDKTRAMHARIDDAQVARSICPYCGVGCGQLIYHKDGKLVSIEGDPESPISQGNLCPKGRRLINCSRIRRETKMKYRAPRTKVDGNLAGSRDGRGGGARLGVAQTHIRPAGKRFDDQSYNRDLPSGEQLDNEENYLIKSHRRPGDGMRQQAGYDIAARCPVWAPPSARRATTAQQDLANADCILIEGSSMAEAHPVGFRWVMRRRNGATIIHVDPGTRTSALADIWF